MDNIGYGWNGSQEPCVGCMQLFISHCALFESQQLDISATCSIKVISSQNIGCVWQQTD